MPNNQNELAFQLWWFAYYDHGCACVLHAFSLGLKNECIMSLRTILCGGERYSVQEMQKKETEKQSWSNKVARLAPSAFARLTRVLGPFQEIPGTFPLRSSILPGGRTVSRKDVRGPQTSRLDNPGYNAHVSSNFRIIGSAILVTDPSCFGYTSGTS
jgi:hypothetical protein